MVKRKFIWKQKRNYYKSMNFARKEKFRSWESSCFELFGEGKYGLLFIQKVDVGWYFLPHGIPCFFDYGKVLVLKFSEMGNTAFFWFKKFDLRWYFFQHRIPCYFEYGKVLVLNISEIGNTFFFYLKSWWKVGVFFVFFNFSWYSRTWEIWFFV